MRKHSKIILSFAIIIGCGVFYFVGSKMLWPKKPHLVIRDNITFTMGQQSYEDDEDEGNANPNLPTIRVEDVIDLEHSRYDDASFNLVPCRGSLGQDRMFRYIDTSEIGESFTGTVYANYKGNCDSFQFQYKVVFPNDSSINE